MSVQMDRLNVHCDEESQFLPAHRDVSSFVLPEGRSFNLPPNWRWLGHRVASSPWNFISVITQRAPLTWTRELCRWMRMVKNHAYDCCWATLLHGRRGQDEQQARKDKQSSGFVLKSNFKHCEIVDLKMEPNYALWFEKRVPLHTLLAVKPY